MYLKNILRYPGGKSRAIKQIVQLLPEEITEFREPLVGGGSLFLYLKQHFHSIERFWINDINQDLQLFWTLSRSQNAALISQIRTYLGLYSEGKELFKYLRDQGNQFTELERAARFFILNRITFSGTTEAGGYSEAAWDGRMTESSLERLHALEEILSGTLITNGDYKACLEEPGNKVFVFLDPPYYSAMKSKLYGKNGCDHISFNFEELAHTLKSCKHKWLMTLDDSDYIRDLFGFAQIQEWNLQYGMNNVGKSKSIRGKELFIYNYQIPDYAFDNQQQMVPFVIDASSGYTNTVSNEVR